MAEDLNWQPIASKDMDREQPPHLRISSAGRCVRAQTYAASGKPESNLPGNQARNRMAMGHMAEILILKEMERNGWETKHTVLSDEGQLELELEIPGAGATIKGHPDGIGRHPDLTKGQWVTLECKSMSMDRALDVEESGVAAVYPAYVAQISLYSRKLHEMELVAHPERGIFAMMDRDGRMIPPERIAWKRERVDETLEIAGGDSQLRPGRGASGPALCPEFHRVQILQLPLHLLGDGPGAGRRDYGEGHNHQRQPRGGGGGTDLG